MQKGWVAKCDASPLGLFSFQSAKQTSTFFQDFLPLKTDGMIIKQMQKSSRYSTRFMLKSHAMPMDRGMHEDEKKKL